VNRCGSFIYTTALPPGVCGAIAASVELVQTDEFCQIRRQLHEKSRRLVCELRHLGMALSRHGGINRRLALQGREAPRASLGNTGILPASPIIPVILEDTERVLQASQFLLENGILAVAIRPPTVPQGTARLRLSLNAAHTDEDLDKLLSVMERVKGG